MSDYLTVGGGSLEARFSEGGQGAVPWIDVPARLFTAGNHGGRSYSVQDLDALVASFQRPRTDLSDWQVPVQLDHSQSARDTQGHVRSLERRGTELHGVLRFVGEQAIRPVRERRYRKLSVGIRLTSPLQLKEVSVTPFPAVKDAAIFREDDMKNELDKLQAEFDRRTAELMAASPASVGDHMELLARHRQGQTLSPDEEARFQRYEAAEVARLTVEPEATEAFVEEDDYIERRLAR